MNGIDTVGIMLVVDAEGKIVPSEYAKAAKAAGLDLIGGHWSATAPLYKGGGFCHRSVKLAIDCDAKC